MALHGKRLLVLGGTFATYDLVRLAKSLGVYVVVTDSSLQSSLTKEIADEVASISTNDIPALVRLVHDKKIDGAFCGPSEFNIGNLVKLCKEASLPCYCSPEQWEMCSNKKTFKEYCIRNGVPTAAEYKIEQFHSVGADNDVEYPIIVKPVDGCSSKGISICDSREEVLKAFDFALDSSASRHAVIEQYIDNGGSIFSFRYILDNGHYYPYLTFDTYIVDPIQKRYLISAFTYFPSYLKDTFKNDLDANVRRMFADMGLKNGVAFIQSIPYKGKIYCHEMGYRLSGGMIYKITQPLMNINDMELMLRYALGESIITLEEIERININQTDYVMAQLMIPLNVGKIASIRGLDEIKNLEGVTDFLQYYFVGDAVKPEVMGTLGQHFGRFTLKTKCQREIIDLVNTIQSNLEILDNNGNNMYTMKFDINRLVDNSTYRCISTKYRGGVSKNFSRLVMRPKYERRAA